mgnify:CR=1 FL=1
MEAIINFFTGTLNTVAWLYIFLPCTIVGGLYLTIRNRGIQFTRFGYAMKNTVGKMFQKQEAGAGAVTPLQAVTTALAATVGTGNIVGTSQAIALGGYGAVFWLWLAALLGMMIKYSEVTLSIQYRERDAKGDWVGGPMYYVKNGLGKHWQWVGILFCVFAAIASFGIGNMSQVNSIVGSLNDAIDAFIPAAEGERKLLNFVFGVFATRVMIRGAASTKALRNPWLYGADKNAPAEKKPVQGNLSKKWIKKEKLIMNTLQIVNGWI